MRRVHLEPATSALGIANLEQVSFGTVAVAADPSRQRVVGERLISLVNAARSQPARGIVLLDLAGARERFAMLNEHAAVHAAFNRPAEAVRRSNRQGARRCAPRQLRRLVPIEDLKSPCDGCAFSPARTLGLLEPPPGA